MTKQQKKSPQETAKKIHFRFLRRVSNPHILQDNSKTNIVFLYLSSEIQVFSLGHSGLDCKVFSFSISILYFFSSSVQLERENE